MLHNAHVIIYYIKKLQNSPRFTIRNDKRIAIHAYHKPTSAQQHAVRKLCQLGYSIY